MRSTFPEQSRLETVGARFEIDPAFLKGLQIPEATVERRLRLLRDDGSYDFLPSWRCQHSFLLGPAKGGVRFHPEVTGEEVRGLAFKMTLKSALVGLPMGGAKGGIRVDPSSLSGEERERLCREWTKAFAGDIGPDKDIPAPDMGNGEVEMALIRDEYEALKGGSVPHVVTGKPPIFGGLKVREGATARGGMQVLQALDDKLKLDAGNISAVIQGFGKVGSEIARRLDGNGHKVIAVSDSSGCIHNDNGLDVGGLLDAKTEHGLLEKSRKDLKGDWLDRDKLFGIECDLLVPAATGGQITADIARKLKVKAILELANGGVCDEADKVLEDRGIPVVPDILANSGGVVASYHEWLAGKAGKEVIVEIVEQQLDDMMAQAAKHAWRLHEKSGESLRISSIALAVRRLERVARLRGHIPAS